AALVSRRVDVNVRILGCQRYHLRRPRVTNMTGHNLEIGKFERHIIKIGNWPPRLRRAQRSCVPHLKAKWNPQLNALGIQGIVTAVIRRQTPQPGNYSQASKSEV